MTITPCGLPRALASLTLAATLLTSLPVAHAAAFAFDKDAVRASSAFFAKVDKAFTGALHGDKKAEKALTKMALVARFFRPKLDTLIQAAAEAGEVRSVQITGFQLRATLWWGMVPLRQIGLFLWRTKDGYRILQMTNLANDPRLFDHAPSPGWAGKVALSFGTLAKNVFDAATAGQCKALPVVRPADYASVLPIGKKAAWAARKKLNGYRHRVMAACKGLFGVPLDRITWFLGQTGAVVHLEAPKAKGGADTLSFRFLLMPGPNRDIRLYGLTQPVAAKNE